MKRAQFGLLLFLLIFLAFVPKDKDPIEKVISSLEKWTETNPQEKVHLHTDKPYCVVGDAIWFKAYTVIGTISAFCFKWRFIVDLLPGVYKVVVEGINTSGKLGRLVYRYKID